MKTYKVIKEFTNKVHVQCSCGEVKKIKKSKLNSFKCTCVDLSVFNKDERKSFGRTKNRINNTKKGIPFGLSEEHYKHLIHQLCFYCGNPPRKYSDGSIVNGIDRIDSNKGYERDNVITCCTTCNMMKGTLGYKEFREHIDKLHSAGVVRDTLVHGSTISEKNHIKMVVWMFKRGAYYSPFDVKQLMDEGYLNREDVKYSLKNSALDFKEHLEEIMIHFKDKIVNNLGMSRFRAIKNKQSYYRTLINSLFTF